MDGLQNLQWLKENSFSLSFLEWQIGPSKSLLSLLGHESSAFDLETSIQMLAPYPCNHHHHQTATMDRLANSV